MLRFKKNLLDLLYLQILGLTTPMQASPNFYTKLAPSPSRKPSNCSWMTRTDQGVLEQWDHKEKALKIEWSPPLPIISKLFKIQSMDLVHPKSFPTVSEWPKRVNAFSSYVRAKKKSVDGSVGYIHTHASTGTVVNHCAMATSLKGNSRGTWHITT